MDTETKNVLSLVECHVKEKKDLKKRSSLKRPQCYGGETGVLLSRRTFRNTKSDPMIVSSNLLITQNISGSQPSSISTRAESKLDDFKCNEYPLESKEATVSNRTKIISHTQVGASNTNIVGWDDVLCRPIYQRKPAALAVSASSVSASSDDGNESLNSKESLNSDFNSNGYESFISFGVESLLKKKKGERRSSYGRTRKGKLLGLSVVTQSILADCERDNCTNGPSNINPASHLNDNHSTHRAIGDEETVELISSQKKISRKKHKSLFPKLKESDLKSLAVSRSFFENLDNTEVLQVQSISCDYECEKISSLESNSVRTRRVLNVTNPELRSQYSLYCKSVENSGVKPIDIKEFAKFRGNYFKKSGMFDGILEED